MKYQRKRYWIPLIKLRYLFYFFNKIFTLIECVPRIMHRELLG